MNSQISDIKNPYEAVIISKIEKNWLHWSLISCIFVPDFSSGNLESIFELILSFTLEKKMFSDFYFVKKEIKFIQYKVFFKFYLQCNYHLMLPKILFYLFQKFKSIDFE